MVSVAVAVANVQAARKDLRAAEVAVSEYKVRIISFARRMAGFIETKTWRSVPNEHGVVPYHAMVGRKWTPFENAPGDRIYKCFDHFCMGEFGKTGKTVEDLVRTATAFPELVGVVPMTHQRLILQAPKKVRAELVALARAGATRIQLLEEMGRVDAFRDPVAKLLRTFETLSPADRMRAWILMGEEVAA